MQIRQTQPATAASPHEPCVVALAFAECEQFAAAIRHEGVELVQTVRGRASNQVLLVSLQKTLLRYGTHQSPWLCSGTALRGHVSVVLDTANAGPTSQNGQAIYEAQALGLYGSGAEHFSRSAAGDYFYVPFPQEQFRSAWQAATGEESAVRPGTFRRARPESQRWQALLGTISAIRCQVESAPAARINPSTRGAMEGALLNAIVLALTADQDRPCLAGPRGSARTWPAVVRRAQEHLRAHAHEPVYVLDLCVATGVSERTLRDAFLEQCGMGPMRYLKLRRLHQVRRTLRARSPGVTSVKEVALANGFWDLGRFAIEYRQLFAETPSATLRA